MSIIHVHYYQPNPDDIATPLTGSQRWTPTKRRQSAGITIMPKPFRIDVNGSTTFYAAGTDPDWAWRVDESIDGVGLNTTYVSVPADVEVDFANLIPLDPDTLEAAFDPDPAWYAHVNTLEQTSQIAAAAAQTSKSAAVDAMSAAEDAQTGALASAAQASGSATTATQKAAAASASETAASQSASYAAGHASAADTSRGVASDKAAEASASAATAAGHVTTAAARATDAQTSATNAANSAGTASTKAAEAVANANGFTLGTVTTTAPGSSADATITGTAPNRKLNLILPQGPVGPANTLTVGEVVTGPETPGATGPQGLKGDKGDTGSWGNGTTLGATDLNTITVAGVYCQTNSSGSQSPLSNNYPYNGGYGVLKVFTTAAPADVIQEFYGQSYAAAMDARGFWRRNRSNSVWSPWRFHASARVDQTAGRAIYQWDDVNNREQLVYGDTGWRDIVSLYLGSTIVTPQLRIRREGQTVTIVFQGYPPAGASSILQNTIPVGFRPSIGLNLRFAGVQISSTLPPQATVSSGNSLSIDNAQGSGEYTFVATYPTNDAWPTTLPGVASGSIPNT
jgi:hypothetical protein